MLKFAVKKEQLILLLFTVIGVVFRVSAKKTDKSGIRRLP